MMPLFVFAPGSRGDFLADILFGEVLESTWSQCAIDDPRFGQPHAYNCDKIHTFGPSVYREIEVTEETLKDWDSWVILATTPEDLWEVGWFNYCKRPDDAPLTYETVYGRVCLSKKHNDSYAACIDRFNHVVNYRDLWSVDYINQLYQQVHNKSLTQIQLDRIAHNISINRELLKTNPFTNKN